MTRSEVAAWMRAEHKIVESLSHQLRVRVGAVPRRIDDEWLWGLRQEFARLRTHLKGHFAAEESGGFLEPVLDCRPTLAPEVEHLKHEHNELVELLELIHTELGRLNPGDRLIVADACVRIQHFLSALEHHSEHEELIVTFVYNQDLGGHD